MAFTCAAPILFPSEIFHGLTFIAVSKTGQPNDCFLFLYSAVDLPYCNDFLI